MDCGGDIYNAMVRLVNCSYKKGDDHFKWDRDDRHRLILLIIQSNKTLRGSTLLQFLIECNMMKHDMLSMLLTSNILKLKEILSHIAKDKNCDEAEKFNLFIKLVKDESSVLIDDNNLDQVIKFCMTYKREARFIDKAIIAIMQHSSLDLKDSTKQKSKLMGKIFIKLHKLILNDHNKRVKNILQSLKETILSLGKDHTIFQEQCKTISQFNTVYKKAFKINRKGQITESDADEDGNLVDFIDTSGSNDDDESDDDDESGSDNHGNPGENHGNSRSSNDDDESESDNHGNSGDNHGNSGSSNDDDDDDDESGSDNHGRWESSNDDDESESNNDESFLQRKRKRKN